jgi:hypothetical protein
MSGIGSKAVRAEIRPRVQFVVDTINECYGLDIPQSEVTAAMHSTQSLCDFAVRYGQSIDWLALGNVKSMVMDGARNAGWRRKVAS